MMKVNWIDKTLTAEVLDHNGDIARVIQYTKAAEYEACKNEYEKRKIKGA